jgi:hypothetical protein
VEDVVAALVAPPSRRHRTTKGRNDMRHTSTSAEFAAVLHILRAPTVWRRARKHVGPDEVDWPSLLAETETMSGGEGLLVRIAHELWNAEKSVGLWEIERRLDPLAFERVLGALRIARGEVLHHAAPALSEAAAA